MDRTTPVATYSPGNGRTDSAISQREAGRHSDAFGGGQAIDWVYDSVNIYADGTAAAPFRLEKSDGTKLVRVKTPGTPPDYEVGPDDLYELLHKPNPFMLYEEMLSLLVIDLLLVGNGYWMKWQTGESGRPLALYRLAPSHVKIITGPYGPKRYEYAPPGARRPLKLDPSDVMHFRRPNPHSAYYGMGVIQGAGRSMDLELAVTDTMAHYYENRADPSLIVQSERRVPRDVFNKLRAQLRVRTAGPDRAGDLLLLESGLKASTLSRSAADNLFQELAKMSRDRILSKFRVSPMLLGIMDEGSSSNKISDVRREFDNSTLRPFMARLSHAVTAGLTDAWGVKYVLEPQTLLPPEDAVKVAGEIAKVPGIKVREVRKQYEQFGIPESTGDPDIDEFVLNMPTPEIDENGQITNPITGEKTAPEGADRPLPGEPGRPPKGENTRGFGVAEQKSLEDLMDQLAGKALNSAGERVTVGNRLPDERRPSDNFAAARQADINSASKFLEDALIEAAVGLERGLLDTVEGKALKTSDIVSRIKAAEAWKTFRSAVEESMREGITRAASSGAMQSGLTPDEPVDYDAIADSVIHRKGGLTAIVNTLKDRVVSRVKKAREGDAERSDYDAEIRNVIKEWSASQAATVAETEAVHGYNEATLTAAELSGVGKVFVTDGDDHDEPCKEADGQVWDVSFARENRLEHPRCRRAFLPLTSPEVA